MWCFWQTLVFAQAPKASHVALQSNFVDNLRGFRSQNKLKKVHIGGIWRGPAPGWLKTTGGLEKRWKLMVMQEKYKQLKWDVVEVCLAIGNGTSAFQSFSAFMRLLCTSLLDSWMRIRSRWVLWETECERMPGWVMPMCVFWFRHVAWVTQVSSRNLVL